jgi:diguanylate cyclase (GGDEF)-like protein
LIRSLRTRIHLLAALVLTALAALGILLVQGSNGSRDAFVWVTHTREVMLGLDRTVSDLRRAESNLRGYLLSGEADFLTAVSADVAEANAQSVGVQRLVADNGEQEQDARRLTKLVRRRGDIILAAVRMVHSHPWRLGVADRDLFVRAKAAMGELDALTGKMQAREQFLLRRRAAWAERRVAALQRLLLIGLPVFALLLLGALWLLLVGINRPLCELLDVVSRFGAGERDARARVAGRSKEFARLAQAYNDMADTLVGAMERSGQAEADLAHANVELVANARVLERRSRSVTLVSEMAQRMQAVRGAEDLRAVLNCFLPKLLGGVGGALFVHNHSRNRLVRQAGWGDPVGAPESWAPDECWALRRGQPHGLDRPGVDVRCAHAAAAPDVPQHCEPLLAGGDVLGLLYVEGALDEEARFRLSLLAETIALALVNEDLRKRLREQSIRDPLTQLFNRRYLEESLTLETARAARAGQPLTVIMADVDHFKRFNDTFGHTAGDHVLQAVGAHLRSHFRDGDLVCRYGGEEFTVIAPAASADQVRARVEMVRLALHGLAVEHERQLLGPVRMSFGVACWDPADGSSVGNLLARADGALYRAKGLGRDRVEVDRPPPLAIAAE